jgi:hypothetical protein
MTVRTNHEWIQKLAAESDLVADMQLETILKNANLDTDAFKLANSDAHCNLVTRAIRELLTNNFSSKENARNLLCNLIERQTYGAFAELAAYDWLTRSHVAIATQVAMTSSDVLATKGSALDGKIEHAGTYFDVKAFGSNGRLAQRLKERLEKEIPDEQVLIEESWDLSFEMFRDLIEAAPNIAAELKQKRMVRKGRMHIRLEAKKPVTVSMRRVDPYHLAKENALYPFRDAKQFTRNSPFILIFVVHPWFNALSIHNDFAGVDTTFTRSLARRAFMQFSVDPTPLTSIAKHVPAAVTLADASRLLSAIFFVNVWPKEADPTITYAMPSCLYLNPRATHRLTQGSAALFRGQSPNSTYIDDFSNDDY